MIARPRPVYVSAAALKARERNAKTLQMRYHDGRLFIGDMEYELQKTVYTREEALALKHHFKKQAWRVRILRRRRKGTRGRRKPNEYRVYAHP